MFNIKRISAGATLWAVLTVFTQSALALGLGNISVESYLNQPLRAKIDLIVRADDDLSSATVGMASADDYALIGASRDAISVPLRFDLEQDAAGARILVTSEQSVKDPVIRLIVEVNWASGRLLREYTLFLDPPSFSAPAPPPPVVDERGRAPVSPPSETAEWVPSDAAAQPDSSAGRSRSSESVTGADMGNEYGPVRSGDTLWRVAADWSQGKSLDMNAIMLAIQRNNPQAFIRGNVNLLKQGAILRLPQVDEVRQISEESARAEVVQQNRAFAGEMAAPAVETPLLDANSQPPSGADAEMSSEPRDQLELVPPADKEDVSRANGFEQSPAESQASTAVEALRSELARKEEELIVEQQQNQYLQEQIAELKDQLQSAPAGNVTDAELAQMESQLREERLSGEEEQSAEQSPTALPPVEQTGQEVVPEVTSSSSAETEKPWYSSLTLWLVALLVAGAAGWFISRRNSAQIVDLAIPGPEAGAVREMKNEAEEILQVLKTDKETAAGKTAEAVVSEDAPIEESKAKTGAAWEARYEEAELLDEDSADPEVRLDLARAYISMGDREAARVILDEVVDHGSEEQQAEARKMLGLL
jgi:pilus assembly protein FimV